MNKLPPLPDHPEPWAFKWTAQELQAITEYGQLCRDQALDEAALFLEAMHKKCNGSHNYYMHAAVQMLEKLK